MEKATPENLTLESTTKMFFFTQGRVRLPKRMNFVKSSTRPLTPLPSFLENYIAIFSEKKTFLKLCLKVQNLQY